MNLKTHLSLEILSRRVVPTNGPHISLGTLRGLT